METIRVPKKFKENLEKRFNIKRFKKTLSGYWGNQGDCKLCQEYREGDCCTNCPFEKLDNNFSRGCINFLQQAKVNLDLEHTTISLAEKSVYTYNIEGFEKIIEYASKYIEFY